MSEPEKAELKSMDVAEDKRQQLAQMFPEVITETRTSDGKLTRAVDFEKLKAVLGTFSEVLENQKERYGMTWPGKNECLKIIQQPSIATLKPCREESVNFDQTENLFIEGDNLEVLKLLQKAYYGKVKMIYIDPPYNTGKEFIYPDKYSESLDTYLAYTGQVDAEGRKFSTNTEAEGRYHSNWMKMMYPRIYLAHNLMCDNGVLFVSINDQEQINLKALCNEVFGEENFLAQLIWDRNHSAQAGIFKVYHEYILVYAKNKAQLSPPKSSDNEEFDAGAMKKESARHPMQKFTFPKGTRFDAPHGTELKGKWGEAEKVILHSGRMISEYGKLKEDIVLEAAFTQASQMKQYFYGDKETLLDSRGQKITEFYFTGTGKLKITKERSVFTPPTVGRWGMQGEISVHLASIFGMSAAPLETPKNPDMIREFIKWFCDDNDLIVDMFAGSCATAHAVLDTNMQDGGNRKFIMVQLPEPCDEKSEAYKAGYKTIADIGKERIRRVIKKLNNEDAGKLDLEGDQTQDRGFRMYKLDRSNFKVWDSEQAAKAPEGIAKQLELHEQHIDPNAGQEGILYELLLKAGFPLTTNVEKVYLVDGKPQKEEPRIDTDKHGSKTKNIGVHPCSSVVPSFFSVADGALLICLEREITKELIKAMADADPLQVICLDEGFKANDQLKANAVQTFKARSQGKESATVFRTV